ncbi:restriction endonuclease subunit S [Listeria seeligeri]|uniref:restriction endonuclease subunit S n=1 Tax=Listeria seeligeri TaxID=1640 RepID=UPI0018B033A0|nr:restriction endonuclease subunit S [Listeria seeligeri]QPJ26862.1 restriction endonuclease subunit S [Listeria seeligeri]
MSDSKKNAPKRRFEEFSNANDWEQRKLGGLMNITSVKRIHQSDWTDKGVRFLRARDIVSASKGKNPSEYLYISKKLYDEHSKISGKVGVGDLLVTGVGSIGIPMLIKHEEPLYFKDGNIIWFQNKKNIDGGFFYYSFNSHSIQKFIRDSAGIGTVGTYTIDSGGKTPIYLPNKKEQQRIGTFFKQLDNTIALHQRKLEKIKALKTAYLSEMFPAEGELKPKRRFAGFTDDWKKRKLGGLATFSKGSSYTKNDLIDNGKPIVLYGRLYTKYQTVIEAVDTFAKEKFNSVISEGNEVLVPTSGETSEEISRASVIGESGVVLGGDLNIIKPDESIDSIFLALTISNGRQKKELSKRAQGKSVVHLHNSDLKQVNLLYPKLEEQQKIGMFFKQLDNTIALHQRKLQKLQNIKKAYLNEMFI